MTEPGNRLGEPGLEIKTFQLEIKDVSDDGVIEGYASVFGNVDKGGDVVEPGAFTKTLSENPNPPILYQHDPYEPIGVTIEAKEDGRGLAVSGQLTLAVQRAAETHALLRAKAMRGLSIGYKTIQGPRENGVRRLKELKLAEWSPVTFPMNELAIVSAVKSGLLTRRGLEALDRLADGDSGLSIPDDLKEQATASADLLLEIAAELKEGRTLSASSLERIAAAFSNLEALLAAAKPDEGSGDVDGAAHLQADPAIKASLRSALDDIAAISRKED